MIQANNIVERIRPYSRKVTIAGSLRRGAQAPRDIDLVVIPKDREKIVNTIGKMGGKVYSTGQKQTYFKIDHTDVNIYYTTPQSYGTQLLHSTGSKGHNIGLRNIARSKGMVLSQYGLYKNGKLVAGRTEKGIYEALGRPRFKGPEMRG